ADTVPAGGRPSPPSRTCTWATAPSAVTTANTAGRQPSGEAPRAAGTSAPRGGPPGAGEPPTRCVRIFAVTVICCASCTCVRLVSARANTAAASLLGALPSGRPVGSMTVLVPRPLAPNGLFANQGRPKALLIEM